MGIWEQLLHIKKQSSWGNPAKMDGCILWILDKIEGMSGKKLNIHCGYENNGHAPNSYHKTGQAVDFHIIGLATLDKLYQAYFLVETVLKALQISDKVGLGVYLDWVNGTMGFHLDYRGTKARWGRINGKYNYNFDDVIKILKSYQKK